MLEVLRLRVATIDTQQDLEETIAENRIGDGSAVKGNGAIGEPE